MRTASIRVTATPRLAAAIAGVLLAWMVFPHGATAGTYTVSSCRTSTATSAGVDDWSIASGLTQTSAVMSNGCPSGPLAMALKPGVQHPVGDYVLASFTAPPDTFISSYSIWRSAEVAPSTAYVYSLDERFDRTNSIVDVCDGQMSCSGLGDPGNPSVNQNEVADSSPGQKALGPLLGLDFFLTCLPDQRLPNPGTPCSATSGPSAAVQLHRSEITLQDDVSPVIESAPSGPLVEPGRVLVGAQPVTISATDKGGGVYQMLFEVDGKVVQRSTLDNNAGLCSEPFTEPVPCKLSASATIAVDTSQVSDGAHQLRLLVTDATGTNTAAWGPVRITTANAACNPRPSSSVMSIRAAFGSLSVKHPRTTVLARYGATLSVHGRLKLPSGAPVAHADVCLAAQDDRPGAPLRTYRSVATDATGRFTLKIARGPSRRLWVVHRVADGAVAAALRVRVRAQVAVRPARRRLHNGDRLILRGHLRGPVPKRGIIVLLKVWRGTHWQTFEDAHAHTNGHFSSAYRFTRTAGLRHYRIRAVVPVQTAYPYAAGWSRSFTVRVRG